MSIDKRAKEMAVNDLYEIWENVGGCGDPLSNVYPWRAQLHGYIGHFATEDAAKRFVAAVKHERNVLQPRKA